MYACVGNACRFRVVGSLAHKFATPADAEEHYTFLQVVPFC